MSPPARAGRTTEVGPLKVQLWVSSSCPHAEEAQRIVTEAMHEAGLEGGPEVLFITGYEDAKEVRAFGSPTIRVDGIEIEYWDREPEEFTAGCRYYNTSEGWVALPHKGLVLKAIQRKQGVA